MWEVCCTPERTIGPQQWQQVVQCQTSLTLLCLCCVCPYVCPFVVPGTGIDAAQKALIRVIIPAKKQMLAYSGCMHPGKGCLGCCSWSPQGQEHSKITARCKPQLLIEDLALEQPADTDVHAIWHMGLDCPASQGLWKPVRVGQRRMFSAWSQDSDAQGNPEGFDHNRDPRPAQSVTAYIRAKDA